MAESVDNGYCLDCDTLLLPTDRARCPGCRRGFDLGDPRSYQAHARIPLFVARFAFRPVTWRLYSLALFAALVLLWDSRVPNALPIPVSSRGVLLGMIPLALLTLRLVLKTVLSLHCRLPLSHLFTGWARLAVVPGIAALVGVLLWADVPLRLGFAFSKPIFEQEVRAFREAPFEPTYKGEMPSRVFEAPRRLGVYWMDGMALAGEQVRFYGYRAPVGLRGVRHRCIIFAQGGRADFEKTIDMGEGWWAW